MINKFLRQTFMEMKKQDLVGYAMCLQKACNSMAIELKRLGKDDDLTSGEIYRYYMSQPEKEELKDE